jgi:hypothetical protein
MQEISELFEKVLVFQERLCYGLGAFLDVHAA